MVSGILRGFFFSFLFVFPLKIIILLSPANTAFPYEVAMGCPRTARFIACLTSSPFWSDIRGREEKYTRHTVNMGFTSTQ